MRIIIGDVIIATLCFFLRVLIISHFPCILSYDFSRDLRIIMYIVRRVCAYIGEERLSYYYYYFFFSRLSGGEINVTRI